MCSYMLHACDMTGHAAVALTGFMSGHPQERHRAHSTSSRACVLSLRCCGSTKSAACKPNAGLTIASCSIAFACCTAASSRAAGLIWKPSKNFCGCPTVSATSTSPNLVVCLRTDLNCKHSAAIKPSRWHYLSCGVTPNCYARAYTMHKDAKNAARCIKSL